LALLPTAENEDIGRKMKHKANVSLGQKDCVEKLLNSYSPAARKLKQSAANMALVMGAYSNGNIDMKRPPIR